MFFGLQPKVRFLRNIALVCCGVCPVWGGGVNEFNFYIAVCSGGGGGGGLQNSDWYYDIEYSEQCAQVSIFHNLTGIPARSHLTADTCQPVVIMLLVISL